MTDRRHFMDYVAEEFLPHARETEGASLLLTETRAKALVWEFGDLSLEEITPERIRAFRERAAGRTSPAVVDRYVELLDRIVEHASERSAAAV